MPDLGDGGTVERVAPLIRPFEPGDQVIARRIIVDGLGEHFGVVKEAFNPDLDDIASSYRGETFLVAELGGGVVGTGALIYEGDGFGRVMRMSMRKEHRRKGIASAVLERLIDEARSRGYRQVVLETGFWKDSIGFYKSRGFLETSRDAYGPNMRLEL